MRLRRSLAVLGALVLVLTACGGDGDSVEGRGDVATSELPARPAEPLETERLELSWETPDGESWALDVVAPVESVEGGWPVLVTFHGSGSGTSASAMAEVATSGVVVVGPRWAIPEWNVTNLDAIDPASYVDGAVLDVAKCALGAAQQAAADNGGNPDWTTVEGFSAGVHPAAWLALGVVRDDPCADTEIIAPSGVVLGDSQWLFEGFGGEWDETFIDEASQAPDTVDRFLNPERWTVPDGFVAYLWSTESTIARRPVENPPAEESWLRARGGDDIIDDLGALGAFDDESVGLLDNGLLMERRMRQAELAVLHEQLLGDHSRKPEVIDRTIEVIWKEPLTDL